MIDELKVYNIEGEYLGTFDELFSIDEEEETQVSSFLFANNTSYIIKEKDTFEQQDVFK